MPTNHQQERKLTDNLAIIIIRITDFLSWTASNNVPVDFISTHEYPTDINPTYRDVMQDGKILTSQMLLIHPAETY